MQNLMINEELKNLLPPLSADEFAGLKESILKDGCLTPLIVWNGVLVDGHYRYEICRKYGIPFAVKDICLKNLEDAKLWAWNNQEHRRNLSAYHRVELALKFKAAIAEKARKNQCMAGGSQRISGEPINTASEVAKIAGVSRNTLQKVEYLHSFADEETKNRLRRGDKGTSINREYNRLKVENAAVPLMVTPATTPGRKVLVNEDNGTLLVREDATPEELTVFLVDHFPVEYVRELLHELLKQYEQRCGQEATQHFLLQIWAEHID